MGGRGVVARCGGRGGAWGSGWFLGGLAFGAFAGDVVLGFRGSIRRDARTHPCREGTTRRGEQWELLAFVSTLSPAHRECDLRSGRPATRRLRLARDDLAFADGGGPAPGDVPDAAMGV